MQSSRKVALKNGFRFYFTGKPCKSGHTEKRYASNGDCKQCNIDNAKNFREVLKIIANDKKINV
jgi:hypothetical protein